MNQRHRQAAAQLIDPLLQVGRDALKAVPSSAPNEPPRPERDGGPAIRAVSIGLVPPPRDIEAEVRLVIGMKIFDVDWYRRGAGQTTTDVAQLVRHYLSSEEPDRWTPNPLFDPAFYLRNHGHELAGMDPFVHYLREGWVRGFDPHPLFDLRFYFGTYADVRLAGIEPLFHYTTYGWREGRKPCAEFDGAYYLEKYEDVRTHGFEPLRHYLEYGAAEGRDPSSVFETRWYARHVLKDDTTNPLAHFRATGSDPDVLLRDIVLDARHTMSQADFERWTRAFRATSTVAPSTEAIIRVHAAGHGEGRDASSLATARTLSRAASATASEKSCSGARHVYVVCEPTDEIDDALLPHLSRRMERAELVVFDFAFRHDGGWTPVLLPGANAAQIEAVDATFSRFAISSRLLARLDIEADAAPWMVLKAAIARLRADARLDLFQHLAMPLLRAEDLSRTLRATRRNLARDAHLPSAPRGEGPSVSIVICTKDRCRLLSQLLDRLLALPAALVRDIVIVTNAATDSFAADVHAHYADQDRVTLLRHEGPYNFSQQSNRGAACCTGDLLLFLNDDIVPIVPHWLDALRAPFARPEVGVTGPLLLYPDESIQHAGMYLGFNGVAGHTLRGARLPEADYMLEASAPRNVSVLTGAAMLTRRALFETLNGFDRQLGTYLQDVDYCLRVRNCDSEVVYEPRASLFHMESVSMREKAGEPVFGERRGLEHRHFVRKWPDVLDGDPYHNPNFDVQDESLRTLVRCPSGAR